MAGSGELRLAMELLRTTLANTDAWAAMCETEVLATLLARIYFRDLPAPTDGETYTSAELETLRPYIVIYSGTEPSFAQVQDAVGGSGYEFHSTGSLGFRAMLTVPSGYADDPALLSEWIDNFIGDLLDDCAELAGQPGYLAGKTWTVAAGPYRVDENWTAAQGDWMGVDFAVDW